MMRVVLSLTVLVSIVLPLATTSPVDTSDTPSTNDESEEAGINRRGILYTDNSKVQLFIRGDSKATWQYNWDSLDGSPGDNFWEYVPMLWGATPDHTSHWYQDVDKTVKMLTRGAKAHVLAFNEPDMCEDGSGGACMTLEQAVDSWKTWIEPLRRYGDVLKLGSPSVTNRAEPHGLAYLEAFIQGCDGCKIDFVDIHWYNRCDNIDDFKQHVTAALKVGDGRPLWITEFACTTGSVEQKIKFLDEVMPWLDGNPLIHRYAYTYAAPGVLLDDAGTELSELGIAFNSH